MSLASAVTAVHRRPLPAIGGVVGLATWLGITWASICGAGFRQDTEVWLPGLLILLLLLASRPHFSTSVNRTLWAGLMLGVVVAIGAAWRWLPARQDLYGLLPHPPDPTRPLAPVDVKLSGVVEAPVYDGAYGQQFAFAACTSKGDYCGRTWMAAPAGLRANPGDHLSLTGRLAELESAGNPQQLEPDRRFHVYGCYTRCRVRQSAISLQPATPGPIDRCRQLLADHLATPHQPYGALTSNLLLAMVFGESSLQRALPPLVRQEFRDAGLAHVLVASGTQVTMLAVVLLGLLRLAGIRRWSMLLALIPFLLLYALVTGGAGSIWRATLTGILVGGALLLGRDTDGLSLWALAWTAILLVDPGQVFDLGFGLTFAATWGLLVLAPALDRRCGVRGSWLLLAVAAPLASLPLLLAAGMTISVAGFLSNLVVLPLAGVLVGLGLGATLWPALQSPACWLTDTIHQIAVSAAQWPGTGMRLPAGTVPLWLLPLCLLGVLVPSERWREWGRIAGHEWTEVRRRSSALLRPLLVGGLLILGLAGWRLGRPAPGMLLLSMLDVGQGESLLLRTPDNQAWIMDGGSLEGPQDPGHSILVPYLYHCGIRRLRGIMVSHPDADHCNALLPVLEELPVGELLMHAGNRPAAPEFRQLLEAAQRRGIPVRPLEGHAVMQLGAGVTARLLWPQPHNLLTGNDDSAVVQVCYRQFRALLTADIEAPGESMIAHTEPDLQCTVLKVSHHGSNTGTTSLLLDRVRPRVALISCGRYNKFGHPALETLERLRRHHVTVFRTDLQGCLEVQSDGRQCWVTPFR